MTKRQLTSLFAGFVATALVLLIAASGASASKVVIDSVENPMPVLDQAPKGGKMNTITVTGMAVNDSGTGGAGAGDFYLVDSGYNRIQRFSASGEFKELWGFDVVETGPENGSAIQSLTVDAGAGQFKLSFGADTTTDLAYNATASQVQTALQSLGSIGSGNVRVTGGPGNAGGAVPYGIVFTGSLAGSAQSPIVASSGTTPLSGGGASATVRVLNAGANTTGFEICTAAQAQSCKGGNTSGLGGALTAPYGAAVQQSTGNVFIADKGAGRVDVFTANGIFVRAFGLDVVATGKTGDAPAQSAKQALTVKATGGSFKLTFQGKTTTDLSFDASAAEVQAALRALSSIGAQGVTVTGGPGDEAGTAPYVVTFAGGLTNSPQPLIVASNGAAPLSGGAATAQVATTQAGRTGLEVCVDPADCKSGSVGPVAGALNGGAGITLAPPGAPNAGNVLVTEEQGARVSEFTPAGAFVRAFGFGVVNVGPSKTNGGGSAVQSVKIAGGSGSFKLGFEAQSTPALPFNATNAEVRDALNGLSTIGGRGGLVTVTGGPGDATGSNPYVVSFGGALAGRSISALTIDTSGLGIAVGAEGGCTTGSAIDGVTYKWLRNGDVIAGATSSKYTITAADEGKAIQCQVFARSGNVTTTQASTPYVITPVPSPAPPSAPGSLSLATSGALEGLVNRELTCNAGAWGNAPTEYTYQFLKGGQNFGAPVTTAATSQKITVEAGQQLPATAFQCVVTAKNAGGSVVKASTITQTTPAAAPQPSAPSATAEPLSTVTTTTAGAPGFESCLAASFDVCQAGVAGVANGQFTSPIKIAEDATGQVYVIAATTFPASDFRIQYFTQPGGVLAPQGAFAPSVLKGSEFSYRPTDVAIGPNNHVFVNQIYKKDELPPCIDVEALPEVLTHEFDTSGNLVDTHLRCSNNSGGGGIFGSVDSRALAVNAVTGRMFFLRDRAAILIADEANGPTAVVTPASEVRATSATLNAEIEPLKGPWNTYYHFETRPVGTLDWQRQPGVIQLDPVLGNGTGSGPAKGCPDGNPPKCEVSFVVGGLRPETEYEVRVMAYTWKGLNLSGSNVGLTFGGYQRSDGPTFTTVPSGPTAVTGGANWSSPAATNPSLDLEGQVNAANRRTTVVFEYLTEEQFEASGWANASVVPKAPVRPVEAGRNFVSVEVRQSISNLDPSKTYRYRLVATNDNGTDYGAARTVSPPRDEARYVELISNADGEGMGAAKGFSQPFLGTSQDGKRVFFASQSIGEPFSLSGLNTPFGADRGPSGWEVSQLGTDPKIGFGDALGGSFRTSSELSGVIWIGYDSESRERREPIFSYTPAYSQNELLTQIKPQDIASAGGTPPSVVAGSPDFDTFTFVGPIGATYLPGEKPLASGQGTSQYYQVTDAHSDHPKLSLVNQDNNGVQIGGACVPDPGAGFNVGGEKSQSSSVSASGKVVYFLANQGATGGATGLTCSVTERNQNPLRLFKRVNAEETVAVSAPTCTPTPLCGGANAADVFRGASLDGSVVVFKTNRRVTESDKDSTNDVYVYDETPPAGQPKLVQISAGEAVAPQHPTPGTGAATQGVVKISTDGSRVYFVATGRLTPDATAGSNNLYVYTRDAAHPTGALKFLATFGAGSSELWSLSQVPAIAAPVHGNSGDDGKWGDGHILVFQTPEKLLAEDTDTQLDMYRIDSEASSDAITCMSCAGNGEFPAEAKLARTYADPFWNQPQIASDDGKVVVFWTQEGLIPEDTNGGLDVYVWDDGDLRLVTTKPIPDARPSPSAGTIGDGSVVYFYTAASEVPSDQNSANDVYAARIGGGFPTAEGTFITCLSGDECKAPPAPVAAPVSPGSASFVGPDNPPVKEEKACKKGQVRKNGKCVKKPPAKCKKGKVRKGGKCVKKKASKKAKRAAGSSQKGGRK